MKIVFLNEYLNEKVYVKTSKIFNDHQFPNHVYKLKKTLYDLKQALRATYERLSIFLFTMHGYF